MDEAVQILTALRLLKSGPIGAVGIFADPRYGGACITPDSWGSAKRDSNYQLTKSDLPKLVELCQHLRIGKKENRLQDVDLALRRFQQAYNQGTAEDKLIDFTIALENLLLRDSKNEIRYKFALRAAALLADVRAAKQTRKLIETIYDLRSALVHNGQVLTALSKELKKKMGDVTDEIDPGMFIDMCEESTREVIRAYVVAIGAGKTAKEVVEDLEERMLGGLNSITGDGHNKSEM